MANKSYIKEVDGQITKERPYIVSGENRRARRLRQRPFNNSKGKGLIVTRIGQTKKGHGLFWKVSKTIQLIGDKPVVHFKTI